jgi:hypothetical protein
MGLDLVQLKSLSMDDLLRHLVYTLVIEDDCMELDPWITRAIPQVDSSHHAWARNETGTVVEGDIEISDLVCILRERLLRPTTTWIRDHRICDDNFKLCSEMAHVRANLPMTTISASEGMLLTQSRLRRLLLKLSRRNPRWWYERNLTKMRRSVKVRLSTTWSMRRPEEAGSNICRNSENHS